MKKLSIKMRITLWFTLLMVLIVALVLGFMLVISGSVVEGDAKDRIKKIVEHNADEIEYDDGEIDIDDDFVYFKDGVYSVAYSNNTMLVGQVPNGFSTDEDFGESIRTVESGGQQYYIFDKNVERDLWVRGIIVADGSTGVMQSIIKIAFVTLPFLVILAALGGYAIVKRSFAPIDKMIQAAEEIDEGRDLSKRIDIGEGNDEVYKLARTFDRMFERLEKSFEAEKQFTADVSHELRTPTTVILSQCEYALENAKTDEEYQEALEVVQRQGFKMSRLISQLLSSSRLEQGIDRAQFENTDISQLVQTICEEQAEIAINGIVLQSDIDEGIFASVDSSMITRLLSNLIGNAYRFAKENGRVFVSLSKKEGEITLSVKDNGVGISKENQEKIFKRFYQVNQSRTADETGSMGLGLAMVKQIAEIHCGTITVESELSKGSIFKFKFCKK